MATIELVQTPQATTFPIAPVQPAAHQPLSSSDPVEPAPPVGGRVFFVAGGHATSGDTLTDTAIECQMREVWGNLFAAMKAAGYEKAHLRSTVMYVTMGGKCRLFRRVRDQMLERLPVPSSCIQVERLEEGAGCVAIEASVSR
jgi:enamine deaminase RidA (YjgF/YER057c/UK114 family)